jgi:transcriptional regulator with XRE-family HTH domain
MIERMEFRVGAKVRALRQRHGWRQSDLASRAAISQGVVSLIERGRLDLVSLEKLRRVSRELDADFVLQLRWRGGDLDRLIDEGHAGLVGAAIEMLRKLGWDLRTEVSYSEFGERGSIDVLAWNQTAGLLLVVEVKTELVSVEETLRKHDEKARLASKVAREQFAWRPSGTSRLLVLPDLSTARRRVQRQSAVLDVAYSLRGVEMRSWLRSPSMPVAGLLFIRPGARSSISRKRIRCRKAA